MNKKKLCIKRKNKFCYSKKFQRNVQKIILIVYLKTEKKKKKHLQKK
jgi:hypothetical protein